MKIGIVVWDLNISGGTQRQALELANRLVSNGNSVVVYCVLYNNQLCYPELLRNLNVKYLIKTKDEKWNDFENNASFYKNIFGPIMRNLKNIQLAKRLCNLFDKDLEILNIHDYLTYLTVDTFKKKNKASVVWMANDVPTLNKNTGIEKLRTFLKGHYFWKTIQRKNINKIDSIIVLDTRNKRLVKMMFNKDALIVRSGLDIKKYKFKNRVKNKTTTILSNGIFFPWRRFEDLFGALNIVKNKGFKVKCHHVGSDKRDPEYSKKIYNLCRELGLQKDIIFHGFVSEKKLINLYSTSDIFVFPNYPQTWGLAVFEAMACGTPVICSTGAGAHEVLTNRQNVLLVPPKNPQKIAEKIIELIKKDVLWNKLHKNGRYFVEKNITWDKYAENMYCIFKETLKR